MRYWIIGASLVAIAAILYRDRSEFSGAGTLGPGVTLRRPKTEPTEKPYRDEHLQRAINRLADLIRARATPREAGDLCQPGFAPKGMDACDLFCFRTNRKGGRCEGSECRCVS